uniref:RAB34, member RAS oncogene family b n=1 Tax=Sinocyclocheilus rhinocerous TaxID=307959 RepID=A0A673IF57_9TELE
HKSQIYISRLNVAKVIVVGDVGVGKTCLINRFCKDTFGKTYKATIGVDFEMERFEVLGVPFSLQLWDTAGQERFRCVASTYYRGAQAIIVVFDLSNYNSLDHAREWLEDAMRDNDPSSVLLFLVGTKKDLSHPDQLAQMEQEAVRLSEEIRAEYWAVSALSGESVRDFFLRVASLTFEATVLSELERNKSRQGRDIVSKFFHYVKIWLIPDILFSCFTLGIFHHGHTENYICIFSTQKSLTTVMKNLRRGNPAAVFD